MSVAVLIERQTAGGTVVEVGREQTAWAPGANGRCASELSYREGAARTRYSRPAATAGPPVAMVKAPGSALGITWSQGLSPTRRHHQTRSHNGRLLAALRVKRRAMIGAWLPAVRRLSPCRC